MLHHRVTLSAALATALIAGAAFAQGTNSSSTATNTNNPPSTSNTSGASSQSLPHELEAKMRDQGFTDVKVVPGSFIVSAKDKQGDPVTMVIGPHSLSVFAVSNPSTTGSASDQKSKGNEK